MPSTPSAKPQERNLRTYSNPHGQQFIRTSETHGLLGRPVEEETEKELDAWLVDHGFIALDTLGKGHPRREAA